MFQKHVFAKSQVLTGWHLEQVGAKQVHENPVDRLAFSMRDSVEGEQEAVVDVDKCWRPGNEGSVAGAWIKLEFRSIKHVKFNLGVSKNTVEYIYWIKQGKLVP